MCLQRPGERLRRFSYVWRKLQASPEIVHLVQYGHEIQFDTPPPCYIPGPDDETRLSPEKMEIVREEVKSLLAKGAVKQLSTSEVKEVPGFYSKLFCV